MNSTTLESFINFCDKMQIAEEKITISDGTPNWMIKSNSKYNRNRHIYKTNIKSIYNSTVDIDSSTELIDDKDTQDKINNALKMTNKAKPQIDKLIENMKELADEWDLGIESVSMLKKLILSLDNSLDIILKKDGFRCELWINNGIKNANADKFFGNHSWCIYIDPDGNNPNKCVIKDGGLNG